MRRAVVLVLLLPACSIASGWSDLQGGTKTTSTPNSKDAGGSGDDTSDVDAASDAASEAAAPPRKLRCGSVVCTGDLVCCETDKLACSPASNCTTANGGIALSCTEKSNCAAGEVCCLDTSGLEANCQTPENCPSVSGAVALCLPDRAAEDCFPGESCKQLGSSLLYGCQ